MDCAPDLFDKQGTAGEEDSRTSTLCKSFSCSDLPSVKEFAMKSSMDEKDIEVNRTKEKCADNKTTDSGMDGTSECFVFDKNDSTDGVTDEGEAKKLIAQNRQQNIISSNVLIKENLLVSVNELRSELQQLSAAASSWNSSMKEYLDERLVTFEGIQLKERTTLLKTKSGSEGLKELTKNLDALKKKSASLNSENESLRKEIEANDRSFSEKELRYRNELERQKQYASELESAKELFEAEQQIRFNSAIARVMKEKESALKKADEQLNYLKLLEEKNDEKLQVLFNEKEKLRQQKDKYVRKLTEVQHEVEKRESELEKYKEETQKQLEEKEREFNEQLEKERKEASILLETERQSSVSSSGYVICAAIAFRRCLQKYSSVMSAAGLEVK